jgi:hypothetical protein
MQFNSYAGRLASRNSTQFLSTELFFITTLHGSRRKHSLSTIRKFCLQRRWRATEVTRLFLAYSLPRECVYLVVAKQWTSILTSLFRLSDVMSPCLHSRNVMLFLIWMFTLFCVCYVFGHSGLKSLPVSATYLRMSAFPWYVVSETLWFLYLWLQCVRHESLSVIWMIIILQILFLCTTEIRYAYCRGTFRGFVSGEISEDNIQEFWWLYYFPFTISLVSCLFLKVSFCAYNCIPVL